MRKFAVLGLGRFGYKLAAELAASGAEVIAIDKNRAIIEQIRDEVTVSVRLDSTDVDALKAQGVDKVDVAIVGIGQGNSGFEAAVLTVVNLKNLGVKKIFARAEAVISGQVFSAVGATEVIYPEIESAQRWSYRLIAPQVSEKIDLAVGYSIAKFNAPASFDGKTIMQLQLRQKYNVNVIAVNRGSEDKGSQMVTVPRPDTVVRQEDVLMLAGSDADIAKLPRD